MAPKPHPGTKKQSKNRKRKAADLAAATTDAVEKSARPDSPFLGEVVAFVSRTQALAGMSLAAELPEEMAAALSRLRESEAQAAATLADAEAGR